MGDVKVYIYELLDENNEVFYIGKTSTPNRRLGTHKQDRIRKMKLKILDCFIDIEYKWIHKYLEKGCILENKETNPMVENWNIGDIIGIKTGRELKIKDLISNKIYNSIKEATEKLDVSRYIVGRLLHDEKYKDKNKDLYNFIII